MEEQRYLATDGRWLYRAETNAHHTLWRKDWYTAPKEKQVRNMAGMVLRMSIRDHNNLHANVEPPRKPSHDLLHEIYQFNRTLRGEGPYERFEHVMGRLSVLAETGREDAGLLLENFQRQNEFIQLGRVIAIPAQEAS